jgi:hypothetical protein
MILIDEIRIQVGWLHGIGRQQMVGGLECRRDQNLNDGGWDSKYFEWVIVESWIPIVECSLKLLRMVVG